MFRLARIFFSCIICLLFFSIVNAQSPSERSASISGQVMVGGKPAANAQVTVAEVNPKINGARIIQLNGREFVDRLGYKTTTNADGNYQFTGLPAGHYKVSALSRVYLPENRVRDQDGSKEITIDEGEVREKVDFALVRGGVITGRVTDEENRPQIGRQLILIELIETGQKLEGYAAETDDRGVYRAFGLRAGRYIVMAGRDNDFYPGKKFEPTYHPNATSAEQAQIIEVKEGSEATGIDIRLVNIGNTYAVTGRMIEAVSGKPVPQVRIYCSTVVNEELGSGNWVSNVLTDMT
jgi:hypothetical protein